MSSTGAAAPGTHAGGVRVQPTSIIVCETCGSANREDGAPTGSEQLHRHVALHARGVAQLRARSKRCLMACGRRCTALVQPGGQPTTKYAYVLGDLAPTPEKAPAVDPAPCSEAGPEKEPL